MDQIRFFVREGSISTIFSGSLGLQNTLTI